ncbi:DC-STAMP domain-containing protein 2 [Plakobranchus ocellatus]|uniref:DC-STAMP domain-containing protein 2 n=1 Tax=Plakobranchus ocellatus TaxID=259542 RepID=A0AAV4B547_9GAST|nr:DC-STAMP domain-containing protein 2 [Plakobranchus ocellatus]
MIKKAIHIKRILKEMAENKENRIRELVGLPPLESWWQQCKMSLEVNMELALGIAIFCGLFLSIGLAFFNAIRCLVLIALPNFASSKGRSFMIMYAMVLILNHPVQDFSHNLQVLTDSATCGQSKALNETKNLVEAAASPLISIISGIKAMLKCIQRLADTLRKAFKALVRAVEEIVSVIGKVFSWLRGMTDVCNKNMGDPFKKCKRVS